MSDFYDDAECILEQEHTAREHARYAQQERSYDLAWLVLSLVAVVAMIAVFR